MRPPPLLLGAALLFWGWRTDMLVLSLLAAAVVELPHVVRGRWTFTDSEFNRLWDVCTILFIGAAAYLRFSEDVTSGAYKFFAWMPLVFYPMILGYVFNTRELLPMKTFSWLLRRRGAEGGDRGVAFGWLYLVVCLVATGATNAQDSWFFIGSAALIGWALWVNRPRRLTAPAWGALFLTITTVAFYGQSRMTEFQAFLENKVSELIVKFGGRRDFDPTQSQTAMGRIGRLKQSGRIVMKVKPEFGPLPERLLECTYARLDGTIWRIARSNFEQVSVEPDATTWVLTTNESTRASVRITEAVERKSAYLAVPFGTRQLRELAAGAVETNSFGVIRVRDNPGLLNYSARFGPVTHLRWDGKLGPRHRENDEAIETIARELKIDDLPDRQKIPAIVRFFEEKFRYTTFQQADELGLHYRAPLSTFLLKLRAGHCEYFASATVLLLRHYGIPALYATGYALQELERDKDVYVVRERHGHAWALAYVDNQWVEVDSTPPGWAEAEANEFGPFQGLGDAWSNFVFGFMEWRWLGDWGVFRLVAPWLVIPLVLFLAWRVFGRHLSRETPPFRETLDWPGADSEFFALERRLAKAGLARGNDETTQHWLDRVKVDEPDLALPLEEVLRLHQKYRFGCEPIEPAEREQLRQFVRACLAQV